MVSQEGVKQHTPGKPANQLVRQSPWGKPPYGGGYESQPEYRAGELVMLSNGLYRVKQFEPISTILHLGIRGTLTSSATGQIIVDINQETKDGIQLGTVAKVFPAGIQILLGEQSFNSTNQIITNKASASSTTAGLLTITTDDVVRTAAFPIGAECVILFIPKNATEATAFMMDRQTFPILESPSSQTVVYDLLWGISQHPKYIGADGTSIESGGFVSPNNDGALGEYAIGGGDYAAQLGGIPIRSDGDRDPDNIEAGNSMRTYNGSSHGVSGYGMNLVRYSGMISPKIRVFQPEAVVRFASDREKNSDIDLTSVANRTKSGFLDASDTSAMSPNPDYRLITGSNSNDATLPYFQLLQDTEEDLHDPHIIIMGTKFVLDEVDTEEVRQMIRRSGRFNYKIIQDPTQAYKMQSDGVTGPANGWKEAVEATRGRRMSFEDYKRATDKVTSQTMNMLYGTSDQQVAKRQGADPRNQHRGI
jgi:hypothetical protein